MTDPPALGSGNAPLSQACIKERSEGTVEQRCKRYTLIKMNLAIILLLSSCLTDAVRRRAASLAGRIGAKQNTWLLYGTAARGKA